MSTIEPARTCAPAACSSAVQLAMSLSGRTGSARGVVTRSGYADGATHVRPRVRTRCRVGHDEVMELATIVSQARQALPRVLVAVDFDGTLAPLVPDPEQS